MGSAHESDWAIHLVRFLGAAQASARSHERLLDLLGPTSTHTTVADIDLTVGRATVPAVLEPMGPLRHLLLITLRPVRLVMEKWSKRVQGSKDSLVEAPEPRCGCVAT